MRSQVEAPSRTDISPTPQAIESASRELDLIAQERDLMPWLSRSEALQQGFLVDVSSVAQTAGYRFPVALTRALWRDVNAVPESLVNQDYGGVAQSPSNRLWHLLRDLAYQIDRDASPDETAFVARITLPLTDYTGQLWPRCSIRYSLGLGDEGEFIATIMRPGEEHFLPGSHGLHPVPLSTLPPEAALITDSQEVAAVREALGIHTSQAEEFDGFAVLLGSGDYSSAWGFTGFPYSWKSAYPLVKDGHNTPRLQALQKA